MYLIESDPHLVAEQHWTASWSMYPTDTMAITARLYLCRIAHEMAIANKPYYCWFPMQYLV